MKDQRTDSSNRRFLAESSRSQHPVGPDLGEEMAGGPGMMGSLVGSNRFI